MKEVRYGRQLPDEERAEAEHELSLIADDVAWVMQRHGGQAAMARAWVDRRGEVHVACNLYTKSSFSFSDGGAAVEFRRKLDG